MDLDFLQNTAKAQTLATTRSISRYITGYMLIWMMVLRTIKAVDHISV